MGVVVTAAEAGSPAGPQAACASVMARLAACGLVVLERRRCARWPGVHHSPYAWPAAPPAAPAFTQPDSRMRMQRYAVCPFAAYDGGIFRRYAAAFAGAYHCIRGYVLWRVILRGIHNCACRRVSDVTRVSAFRRVYHVRYAAAHKAAYAQHTRLRVVPRILATIRIDTYVKPRARHADCLMSVHALSRVCYRRYELVCQHAYMTSGGHAPERAAAYLS